MDNDDNDCAIKCKSFQYNNITRKCLLNEEDHFGKYDLVYSWNTNYFYKNCAHEDIIKNVVHNCPPVGKLKLERLASEEISADSDMISTDESKTNHSIAKRSAINNRSSSISPSQSVYWWTESGREEVSNKGFVEELIVTPNLWNKISKKESSAKNLKNLIVKIMEKQPKINAGKNAYDNRSEMEYGTTATYSNREIRSTKEENLGTVPKSSATTTISADYTKTTIDLSLIKTTIDPSSTKTTINLSSTKTTIDLSSTKTTIEPSSTKTTIDLSSTETTTDLSSTKTTNDHSSSSPYEETESLAEEFEEEEVVETNEEDEIRKKSNDDDEKFKNSSNENNSSILKLTTKMMESEITSDQRTTTEENTEFDENEEFDDNSDEYNTDCDSNEENTTSTIVEESSEMIITDKFDIPEADSQEGIDYFDN
ncbi:unnamed protein product, partial [Onchocerca ochengi]|uniref:Apple domain-containing protein n=1 Tax=Onchocerca ochengi TaxID=42157 RepID=A0A182EU84_ONCOC